MKYDIILKNYTKEEIHFVLFSAESKNRYMDKIFPQNEKIIPYEEKGFIGFSEMEFFVNESLIEKIQVYGGNIITVIEKKSKFHVEINYPDF